MYDESNDNYDVLRNNMVEFFNQAIAGGKKLFKTNADDLFETFLDGLPSAEARQHYNCNACRHFFNRYAGLVIIDEDGTMSSPIFNETISSKFFAKAVKNVLKEVLSSKVVGVYIPETTTLGYPTTGEWTHFYVKVPSGMVNRSRVQTASQAMAEKREEFKMVIRALDDFSIDTANKALALIDSEALYRGERARPNIEWFKNLLESTSSVRNSDKKRNLIWLAVATAPTGFTHIRSNSAGTLLKDISDGLSTQSIVTRFKDLMSNYMRSQSTPSENAMYEAEKLVAQLGIAESLPRRYAKYEEIPSFLWEGGRNTKVALTNDGGKKLASGGVFGHLTAKSVEPEKFDLLTSVMTWDKFKRTVLPTADGIEALIDNPNRFMALVTATNEDAPNILQWDNPFSWYYHGGVDAEIKRRVEEAGGRYENNEIRCSLLWEGLTDLDLHCKTPKGETIYYSEKRGRCGGWLDLDMNGIDKSSEKPVENMRWANNAPEGRYKFIVHNFSERVNGYKGTPFKVELEIGGKVYHFEGQPLRNKDRITVFEFDYRRGQEPRFVVAPQQVSASEAWSVESNRFVKVNGITTSPNLWGENPFTHAGNHIFFLLEGVKDSSEGKGRGFFNEMLQPELRQIRKTLELYTANTPIEDADLASACGVGYSSNNEWNLTLRVKSGGSTRIIKIDRWD